MPVRTTLLESDSDVEEVTGTEPHEGHTGDVVVPILGHLRAARANRGARSSSCRGADDQKDPYGVLSLSCGALAARQSCSRRRTVSPARRLTASRPRRGSGPHSYWSRSGATSR